MSVAQVNKKNKSTLPREIASLVVPLETKVLLLPNVSVAEIITKVAFKPVNNKPDWFLGRVDWRGVSVPFVSFEGLNGERIEEYSQGKRVLIINGTRGDVQLPFYAVQARGLPRLMRVRSGDIQNEVEGSGPAECFQAYILGQEVVVPDLDYIEDRILNAG